MFGTPESYALDTLNDMVRKYWTLRFGSLENYGFQNIASNVRKPLKLIEKLEGNLNQNVRNPLILFFGNSERYGSEILNPKVR